MRTGLLRTIRKYQPRAESMEARLVLSAATTIAAEIRAILKSTPGGALVQPNTPVVPLESPPATASFVDPSTQIIRGGRILVGEKDYVAPFVSFDARGGFIKVGSSSSIQDNAALVANPNRARGPIGIVIGDDVVVSPGAKIIGPAAIGTTGGANVSIGANAVIQGAIIQPGAYVGALARVGPGVTIQTGFRVLPGANVTNQAQATDPSLGMVARITSADPVVTSTTTAVARNIMLAAGYTNLYQGNSATGPGSSSGGPIPVATQAGTGVYFGELNTVLGVGSEPTSKFVSFEPASGTPIFTAPDGSAATLPTNLAFRFPSRVIGQVEFGQDANTARAAVGRRDSLRGDEGQAILFLGPIIKLGNGVTFHSPNGGVRSTTTTTVVTTTTAVGVTTTSTNSTTTTSNTVASATPGTTTATTTGRNAAGVATTGTVTTTIVTSNFVVGGITVGSSFRAGDNATILGGPSIVTTFGDNVTVGSGAVVDTSVLGSNVTVGDRAYIANSTIAAGTIIPPGTIVINNLIIGTVLS